MSELQKKISKAQKREAQGGLGFGNVRRELPRAMVLAARVATAQEAEAATAAGADCVIFSGLAAAAAAAAIKPLAKVCAGAQVAALDEGGAQALVAAGCDFVISPLDTTDAMAVDPEKLGHVLEAPADASDTLLRALAPFGLDALYVDGPHTSMTMAARLELVRLSSFSSSALMAPVGAGVAMNALRVLRDSGVGVVVAPAGATAAELTALSEALKAIPAPKRERHGGDIAMVPATRAASGAGDEDDEDDDDDD